MGDLQPEEIGPLSNITGRSRWQIREILRNIRQNRAPAFVLGGTTSNGLSFVRSLGRKGVPVVAIGTLASAAMKSRYGVKVELQDVTDDEIQHLSFLRTVGKQLPVKGVLIPTSDAYVLFMSRNRASLEEYYDFVLSEHSVLEIITNKKLQYQFASDIDIPVPRTFSPERPGNIEQVAIHVSYPCIIKPASSHLWGKYQRQNGLRGSGKVAVAESRSELIRQYKEMSKSGLELLVQERIEGGDDHFYALMTYLNRASQPLAIFTKRKIRQWPVDYGNGSFQTSVWEPEIAELGLKLLKAMGYRGMAMIEFKKDPRDGKFKLIELNPRSVLPQQIAIDCGVDFPFIVYQDARGQQVVPVNTFKTGVKWINFEDDVQSYLQYRRTNKLSLLSWLRSIKDARSFAYFAWYDPAPFLLVTLALAKRVFIGTFRKWWLRPNPP